MKRNGRRQDSAVARLLAGEVRRHDLRITAAALLTIALLVAFQVASPNMRRFAYADRDWNRDLALMGNDLPVLLKYNPTDGASSAGKVRKAMKLTSVQP